MDPWAGYRIPTRDREGRERQQRSPQSQNSSDQFYARIAERALAEEERQRQREAVTRIDPSPDQAGEARRVARETGAPVPVVRENLPAYRDDRQRSDVARAARDPRLGTWLSQNADVASDDVSNLLHLGAASDRYNTARRGQSSSYFQGDPVAAREFRRNASPEQRRLGNAIVGQASQAAQASENKERGVLGQLAGSLRAGTSSSVGGFYGTAASVAADPTNLLMSPLLQLLTTDEEREGWGLGSPRVEQNLLGVQRSFADYAARNRGVSDSFVVDSLYGGVESIPLSLMALATRNPQAASALFFSSTAGNSYSEARGAGLGIGDASRFGFTQGGIEVVTERLPTGRLLDLVKGKGAASNAVKRFLIGEAAGEQAATILQDFSSRATLNPEKPFSEFLAERPEAAARTFLGTVSGAGPQAAAAYGLNRAFREEARLLTSVEQLDALDALIEGSAESRVRGRDPIAFRALLDQLAGDGENIFVPASSIAEFNQDYRDDNFWGDYADQIDEGLATGGSVAVPLGAAAARLAGTPDWDAISGDVRVGADGASRNEIDEANAELEALKVEAGDRLDAEERAIRREAVPRERLREGIRLQLMNTGMTPDVANANAEIVAALFETEAANLGRELTGNEFSSAVSVQRVLPELLASPQASDSLDLVINAMRQGKDAQVNIGISLLEFVRQYGGVNDPGGDLKSMGLPKRYIREVDPGQGSLGIGGEGSSGDYGIDTVMRAAIEYGFFPEFSQDAEQVGVSTLDTQALLDAIGQELSGDKIYSETREDQYRAAGEELRQILESRGVDPDTASDVEIRQAVEAFEREQRQEFDQSAPEGSDAFRKWAGTDEVIDPEDVNYTDFSAEGPFVMRVFHGTTHEFEAFDASRSGNLEGQFGAVNYFTSSERDATGNYTEDGPDLTARIEQRAEAIGDEWASEERDGRDDWSYDDPAVVAAAREELTGDNPQVLEVFVRTEKPFVVGDTQSPWIEFRDFEALSEEALERVADNEGLEAQAVRDDIDEYQDQIEEARWDIESETPDGLFEAIDTVASRYGLDAQELYGSVAEMAQEGVRQSDLEEALRSSEALAYSQDFDTGAINGYHVLGEIIRELGFDSIILKNAEARFENMDMDAGTAHIHVFDANRTNIKSVNNRGTFDPNDARILYQSAFHGSPHQFDKFSTDAIGTGEGAQAYGWGLYFAGKKEIAEHYRNALAGGPIFLTEDYKDYFTPGRLINGYSGKDKVVEFHEGPPGKEWDWSVSVVRVDKDGGDVKGERVRRHSTQPTDQEMKAVLGREPSFKPGRLFEVDIPEDNEYLLWDAAFDDQPEIVKQALQEIGETDARRGGWSVEPNASKTFTVRNVWGEASGRFKSEVAAQAKVDAENLKHKANGGARIYRELASQLSPKLASLKLKSMGVAGVKYLDGTSRADGDGTFNYVVFDDSRVSIKAYEQNQGQGPQGQIAIGDSQSIIKLFETANLSTFQHEMAHFWLERFKGNALSAIDTDGNPAARQTFADYETLKGWFAENGYAVAEDGTIPVETHELFARSWERYLMEGKAPKPSLKGVFRKFAAWMRSIYRLVKNLNAPITPEVREVMDRMLATQDEIAMAAEDRAMHLMFDNALDAGMSEAEALRYGELADEARSQAEEELEGKVMRSIRAREQKQWKQQEKKVRAEVTEMIESRPVFKALAMLRDGYRLDKKSIIDQYGEDALKLLPAGVPPLYKERGDNADQVAEMVGFASGDEMVRALMGLEAMRKDMKAKGDKRAVKKAMIDQEVAIEMHDRFGDPLGDGSIEREAQAAIQNERQGERIELELKLLGTQTNRRPTPYALAQEWAADRIASGVVADTISGEAQQRYTRTAAKASRDAMKAFARGDTEAAFEAKQTEMLHNALAREASKASDAVDKAVKRMGDLAKQRTVKSMSQDYLDRIHGLLEGYEFKRVSQKAINARDEYARWAQEQTEAGHDVVAVERLAQSKNFSRLTVEELLALNDAVKQLAHLGRYKQTLIDGKERREFDAVVGEALGSANELPQLKAKDQFGGEGWLEAIGGKFLSLNAALRKMEDVFDRLDNGRANGVFNRVAFRPIVEAQSREHDMLDDVVGKLKDAMAEVPKESVKRWQSRRTIDELPGVDKYGRQTGKPATFLGEELLVMAMNMGNRGNMEKLIGGYGWDKQLGGMDAAQAVLMDVLNRELSVEDWQYVQTVWDTIDSLWPEISALEKRVNGFAPEKVEAVPLETAAGQLRGGYFPVVYDPASRVGARNLDVEESGLFASNYFRSTTRAGSTKERTSFKGPLNLSLGVINRHVAEVVHDITHREAVMNADKFLSDGRVRQAIIDTMGPEIEAQMRPWLGHIANEWAADREVNSDFERFVKATRTNATVVGLGFRVSTMMLQVSGYSNSIERIGIIPVMRGIRKMLSGPEAWTFALKNSNELKTRMTSMDRDIRDNARKLASKQKNVLDAAQQFAFHGIGYMDRLVSIGSWHGAYDKALAQGMNHDDAVYEADKAIRQSQGSGAAKDMARVQRGTGKMGEAIKLSTMFYSYSSAFYQRQVKFAQDTGDAVRNRDAAQIPDLAARFLWLNIVPALLSQWLAGRWPEDDEDEAAWVLGELLTAQFQAIPFGREIASGLQSGFGYSYTPAEGFGKSVVAVFKDGYRIAEGEDTKRATRNALELIGYSTGKVPGQISTSTQFLVDVAYGEQDPDGIAEWWEGITKGKIKE